MLYLSLPILLILFFLTGSLIQSLLGRKTSLTGSLLAGFLGLLAVFHLIASPLTWLDTSFSLLFWIYLGAVLALAAGGFRVLIRKKDWVSYLGNGKSGLHFLGQHKLECLLMLAFMGGFLFISLGYAYPTSDDSLYLVKSMEIQEQNRLNLSMSQMWFGFPETSFPETVDFSTLEAWKAFWSTLFGIPVVIFARNSFSWAVILISWCALYQAYQHLTGHKKQSGVFIFFCFYLALAILDCGTPDWETYKGGLRNWAPFWFVRYPSQGKAVLLAIIHPALIAACAGIVNCGLEKISWQKWAMLSLTLLAGIATTIVGIFWPFLCCVTMGLPYLLITRRKEFFKLLPSLLLTCVPVIVFGLIAIFGVSGSTDLYHDIPVPSWQAVFNEGLNLQTFLWTLPCLLYIAVQGEKTPRLVLFGGFVTLGLTFLNPLLISPVCRYISTTSVYYRLFWMVPVYFLIAFAASDLLTNVPQRIRNWSVVLVFCLLAGAGADFYLCRHRPAVYENCAVCRKVADRVDKIRPEEERRSNLMGLQSFVYEPAKIMVDSMPEGEPVRVFWMSKREGNLRQYSTRIQLVGGVRMRQKQFFDQPVEPGTPIPYEMFTAFQGEDVWDFADPAQAYEDLKAMEISYITADRESGFAQRDPLPEGFELIYEGDNWVNFYRVK